MVNNDAIEFVTLDSPVESPISELRDDVMAAIKKSVHARYPKIQIIAYMDGDVQLVMPMTKVSVLQTMKYC